MAGRALSPAELLLQQLLQQDAEPTRALAEQAGWRYGSVAQLVLELGSWFVGPAQEGVRDTSFSGPAEQARQSADLVYAEGYYLVEGTTRIGAWCATVPGEVLYGHQAEAYLGIAMPEAYRRATTQRTGNAGVLIGQERDGFQLLHKGFPSGAQIDAGYPGPT